ncbi:unnamed protein product [Protopolystoma xenopodis]|uniref:Uncharacterized protein n=1 Tax=Protopolystoma xenopodis TaxID=117903 RepID=A0A448WHN7_9PLAT|nr:unnamed protein product [Protopolystoma xenopodis]
MPDRLNKLTSLSWHDPVNAWLAEDGQQCAPSSSRMYRWGGIECEVKMARKDRIDNKSAGFDTQSPASIQIAGELDDLLMSFQETWHDDASWDENPRHRYAVY